MAKKSLLDTLTPKPSAADLDRIAEQIHDAKPAVKPPVAPKSTPTPATKAPAKKAAAPPPPAPVDDENAQHRLTIDLPKWLVEKIRTDGKKNGVTVRGVILGHLLRIYDEG